VRVLVVEDDDRVARGLLTALRHAGYEVHRVATAADALRAAPADVVLLDLGLPDGDGLDVLRELRHRPGTAVITVTARGEERERGRPQEDAHAPRGAGGRGADPDRSAADHRFDAGRHIGR
jgi:DNA-binding response OmpR family regulator